MIVELCLSGLIVSGAGIYSILKGEGSTPKGNVSSTPSVSKDDELYDATLDYCYSLTRDELERYIEHNQELSKYRYKIDGSSGSSDRYYMCKNIANLSVKLGRPFTDQYDRY